MPLSRTGIAPISIVSPSIVLARPVRIASAGCAPELTIGAATTMGTASALMNRRIGWLGRTLQFVDRLDDPLPHGLTVQIAGLKPLVGTLRRLNLGVLAEAADHQVGGGVNVAVQGHWPTQ
jgi:hypothetical protein